MGNIASDNIMRYLNSRILTSEQFDWFQQYAVRGDIIFRFHEIWVSADFATSDQIHSRV